MTEQQKTAVLESLQKSGLAPNQYNIIFYPFGGFEVIISYDRSQRFIQKSRSLYCVPIIGSTSTKKINARDWEQTFKVFQQWISALNTSKNTPQKEQVKIVNPNPKKEHVQTKIFISHSSKDKVIVEAFVDWLRLAINISRSDIFCSSLPNHGVNSGAPIAAELKQQLNNSLLSIYIVTPHFNASNVCIAELGAGWLKHDSKNLILLKTADIDQEAINFLLQDRLTRSLYNQSDLFEVADELRLLLNINPPPHANLLAKTETLLDIVKRQEIP